MRKRVPKMCITCQHYEAYHFLCALDDTYIGYFYEDKPNQCKGYSLSEHYRKGGKFYESWKTIDENETVWFSTPFGAIGIVGPGAYWDKCGQAVKWDE